MGGGGEEIVWITQEGPIKSNESLKVENFLWLEERWNRKRPQRDSRHRRTCYAAGPEIIGSKCNDQREVSKS